MKLIIDPDNEVYNYPHLSLYKIFHVSLDLYFYFLVFFR